MKGFVMTFDVIFDIFFRIYMIGSFVFIGLYIFDYAQNDSDPDDYSSPRKTYVSCTYISMMGVVCNCALKEIWETSKNPNPVLMILVELGLLIFIIHFLCRILRLLRESMDGREKTAAVHETLDKGMTLEEALKILSNLQPSFEPLSEREEQAKKIVNDWAQENLSGFIKSYKSSLNKNGMEPCFVALGFAQRPTSEEEIKRQYRRMAKVLHPDAGGDAKAFIALKENYQECLKRI